MSSYYHRIPPNVQWIRHFFDDAGLVGTSKLVAIAIADHADADGIAWPGQKLLARRCDCDAKTIQRTVKKLEASQHLDIIGGIGRGKLQGYRLRKVDIQMSGFQDTKVDISEPKSGHKSGHFGTALLNKEEELNFEDNLKKRVDARKDHPAIQTVRKITNRYPPKEIWDRIISELGANPNEGLLARSFVNWRSHGYKPTNYEAWLFEAARTGEPWRKQDVPDFRATRRQDAVDERNLFEGIRQEQHSRKLLQGDRPVSVRELHVKQLEPDARGEARSG